MKKQLLLFAMILLPLVASADAVEINGIYYNLITKGNVAEVTSNPNKYTGSIAIPEKVSYQDITYSVTIIGSNAFWGCSDLTSVTIPNSVTSIGKSAFSSCSGITSITIPNSVTSIDNYAFYNCSRITSVSIPNSVTSINRYLFQSCTSLSSVTIGNNVTTIDNYAFEGCTSLISVAIPNSVTYIGGRAFGNCTSLSSVTIGNNVTTIDNYAFEKCVSLTSVAIPNSVTYIGAYAFYECIGLSSVKISDVAAWCNIDFGEEFLGTFALANPLYYAHHLYLNDEEVKDLVVPNNVTSIRKYAFIGCSGLNSVTISNSVTGIGNSAFSGCSNLTSVFLSNSVTSIGAYAFSGCAHLKSITIPDGVSDIRMQTFDGCEGLTSVSIGSGIHFIDIKSFANCPNIADVTCYAESVPSTKKEVFSGSYIEYATLHVPSASVNAYKAADPWKNFKSIVAIDGETQTTQKCEKPTISYVNGQLKFASATDGVEFVSEITDADVKKHYDAIISLNATYNISVYAAKAGYENSETATATLCWIDQQPKTEGITNGIANIPANAVLIQSEGGSIKVQGVDEGTQVNVYSINGTQAGSAISQSGAATINTNLQPGSIAIVKIGQKSVKVVIK